MSSKKPRVFRSIAEWRSFRREQALSEPRLTLGFVPTMGALHAGHASLIERSSRENSHTLVSIFVNPTQFNDPKDLNKYPRTFEKDLELTFRSGADYLLSPEFSELYADGYRYRVGESEFSHLLCGASRPGHFDGVLTVVTKLLNLAKADRAYFGEKDYQQLELIRGLNSALFIATEIVACPTIREIDGLAMSSRNLNLTAEEREIAPRFSRVLRTAAHPEEARAELEGEGFRVDYVQDLDGRRFGAVFLGSVRLIDNLDLREVAKSR